MSLRIVPRLDSLSRLVELAQKPHGKLVLHIVLFLEQRYGMDFSDGFDQNDVDSVDSIVALTGGSGD